MTIVNEYRDEHGRRIIVEAFGLINDGTIDPATFTLKEYVLGSRGGRTLLRGGTMAELRREAARCGELASMCEPERLRLCDEYGHSRTPTKEKP